LVGVASKIVNPIPEVRLFQKVELLALPRLAEFLHTIAAQLLYLTVLAVQTDSTELSTASPAIAEVIPSIPVPSLA
jgi:hypothetical protein